MSDWFEAGARVAAGHGDRFPPLGDGEAQRWWMGGEVLHGRDSLSCAICIPMAVVKSSRRPSGILVTAANLTRYTALVPLHR